MVVVVNNARQAHEQQAALHIVSTDSLLAALDEQVWAHDASCQRETERLRKRGIVCILSGSKNNSRAKSVVRKTRSGVGKGQGRGKRVWE